MTCCLLPPTLEQGHRYPFWTHFVNHQKTECKDGHERADVKAHRTDGHCRPLEAMEHRARPVQAAVGCENKQDCSCKGKGCVELGVATPREGEKEVVHVFHDEAIAANEGRRKRWGVKGDRSCMKTKGKAMMVSGFICPCHGRMAIEGPDLAQFTSKHPGLNFELSKFPGAHNAVAADGIEGVHSFTTIEPGKAGHGWWKGEDVVRQCKEVVPIFERLHPGKVGIFIFDNSTNHSAFPPGALGVHAGANKNPGGKNAPGAETTNPSKAPGAGAGAPKCITRMVNGWCTTAAGVRVSQNVHQADGAFKGTAAILVERGMLAAGSKLAGDCKATSGNERPDVPCCCKHLLANQADLKSQPTALEQLLNLAGHLHEMLPKCHPELNPIEQWWAALKERLRRVCGCTFPLLKKNLPNTLRSVDVVSRGWCPLPFWMVSLFLHE